MPVMHSNFVHDRNKRNMKGHRSAEARLNGRAPSLDLELGKNSQGVDTEIEVLPSEANRMRVLHHTKYFFGNCISISSGLSNPGPRTHVTETGY